MHPAVSTAIGRNDPCPCGSGNKYKHCCATANSNQSATKQDYRQLLESARYNAYQLRDFAAAERCYREVLAIKPGNAEALAGVGQGLCWRRRRAEGRQYMIKAAKAMTRQIDKTEGRILLELAEQLQMWGEIDLSLQLCRAAVKRMPNNPSAHYGVASCLHRLNHTDQALAAMGKVLQLAPNDSGCQILMALLELDKKQVSQARQRLERIVETEAKPTQLARACLELSKVYDKQRHYDDAFEMLSRSGELLRRQPENQRVNADYIFDKIALFKRGFDDSLLKRWRVDDLADSQPSPVFLIGFLRSGTTLTEQVLAAHPQVVTSDENQLLDEVVDELEQLTGIRGNTPEALRKLSLDQARELRKLYWLRASEEFTPAVLKKRFVNKVALNSIETGLISCLFPDAKIIFALRDPRDICLSCAMQSFTNSPATINMLSWQGIARQYAAVMDLWLSLRERIAPDYLELRYEDTVNDFENSFRKVFALMGLDWHGEVARYHERLAGKFVATPSFSAVSQPIYRSSLARWQGYAKHFEPILALLQPYIEAFGYQQD